MSSFLFSAKSFVFFVVVICTFCATAHATETKIAPATTPTNTTTTTSTTTASTTALATAPATAIAAESETESSIVIFKPEKIEKVITPKGDKMEESGGNIEFKNFCSPFLLTAEDVMIAFAAVNITDTQANSINILTKYIEVKEESDVWIKDVFLNDQINSKWKVQLAVHTTGTNIGDSLKQLLPVVKENKIYIFLVNATEPMENKNWKFVLVEGNIKKEENNTQRITWETKSLSDPFDNDQFKNKSLINYPYLYSALVINDKKIVFVVKGYTVKENKWICAIIEFDESKKTLKVLHVDDTDEKCHPYLIPWEEKIIMISANCINTSGAKMKQIDLTKEVSVSDGSFGRRWKFLIDKKDFISAKINNMSVVLFTQERKKSNEHKELHLWITDRNRTANVGIVFAKVDDYFYSSFLSTENQLFSLHKNDTIYVSRNDGFAYNITYFPKQMKNITSLLKVWEENKKKIDQVCKNIKIANISCSTDGLVGFLSNKSDGDSWQDDYLYMNATVTEGTKVEDGFQFNKSGACARWSVGKAKEDQPYNFVDSGFTLVANVTINGDNNENKDISLLGLGLNDNTHIGLWCASNKQWRINKEGESAGITVHGDNCVQKKQYIVGIVFANNVIFVYVDGKLIGKKEIKINNDPHFYFGAVNCKESDQSNIKNDITVTNVLLYNRPFIKEEDDMDLKNKNTKNNLTTKGGGSKVDEKDTSSNSSERNDKRSSKTEHDKNNHSKDASVDNLNLQLRNTDGDKNVKFFLSLNNSDGHVSLLSLLLSVWISAFCFAA